MTKRIFGIVIALLVALNAIPFGVFAATAQPNVQSEAAILVDRDTGKILYEKNIHERLYPASTTKVMTALLVLEKCSLDERVTASYDAVMSIPVGGSNMGLREGEELSVKELLYGVLVASANEACNVLAEHIAGSVDAFVEMMNNRVSELGLKDTHFVNPHGLHDDDHYTTAYDLSVIAREAMKNETFRDIVSTARYTINPTDKYPEIRYLNNTNYLISTNTSSKYFYSKANGVKTGYTSQAGNCLVSSASKTGTNFLAVTLNARPQADEIHSFTDAKALFEYGYDNYKSKVIIHKDDVMTEVKVREAQGVDSVVLNAKEDLSALLPVGDDGSNVERQFTLNEKVSAPIEQGDVLGSVTLVQDGITLGSVELVANNAVKRDMFIFIMNRIFEFFANPIVFIPLGIILLIVLSLYITRRINRRRRRKYLRSRRY